MPRHIASLFLCCLVALSSACFSKSQPLQFTEEWPARVDDYQDVTDKWTRRGLLRASLSDQGSQLMELYATFLSTEWRAAYVQQQAELQTMSDASRQKLAAEQKQIAAESHQVKLLVSTYHQQHNDLHRDRSIWRVVLVDGAGNEIPATKIEKDRRPRELIAAEFEKLGDFAEAYLATFPPAPTLLAGQLFSLRVTSSLGTVEVKWRRQP